MTQGAKPCVIFRYKVKRLVGREFGFLNISSKPVIHINYKSLYSKVRFDWQQRQEVDTEKRAQLMICPLCHDLCCCKVDRSSHGTNLIARIYIYFRRTFSATSRRKDRFFAREYSLWGLFKLGCPQGESLYFFKAHPQLRLLPLVS